MNSKTEFYCLGNHATLIIYNYNRLIHKEELRLTTTIIIVHFYHNKVIKCHYLYSCNRYRYFLTLVLFSLLCYSKMYCHCIREI